MLSRGGAAGWASILSGLAGAGGLLLRRDASQNPEMLLGRDRFLGSPDTVIVSVSPNQWHDSPTSLFRRGKGTWGGQESSTSSL